MAKEEQQQKIEIKNGADEALTSLINDDIPENDGMQSILREQWRPFIQMRPTETNKKYIILVDYKNNDKGRFIRCGFWNGKRFITGNSTGGNILTDQEKVVAWIPFPALDLFDVDAEELTVPTILLYGELRRRYRIMRDACAALTKANRKLSKRIEELQQESIKTDETIKNVQKNCCKDYKERINELESEILSTSKALKTTQSCLDEYKKTSREATVFIQGQKERIDELEKLQSMSSPPKAKIIPASKLLDLPLVGDKMISVLAPFLEKYNVIIDPNK